MIIVQLTGGLGNQMFQYAFGRGMAHFHNTSLKMDVNYFANQGPHVTPRAYELGVFNLDQSFASKEEIATIQKKYPLWLQKSIGKLLPRFRAIFKEKNDNYTKSVFFTLNNVYFKGYWQNEKYFKNIESLIREDFTFKNPLPEEALSLAKIIDSNTSVSIHIRRTDYLNKTVGKVCTPEYYKKAIRYIVQKTGEIFLFVFSDDIEWTKENMLFDFPTTYIDKKYTGNVGWIDLYLMSRCKHNIIANSSFSWWAAWLNANPDKIVVTPNEWNYKKNIHSIIPSCWQIIT
ncbi:MAG: alpha-1,2-fucosyltransferase [Bacteroidales bacterium]|nr:alpha-1,2-fucosyltransferase [Bacteroidales bacterium]